MEHTEKCQGTRKEQPDPGIFMCISFSVHPRIFHLHRSLMP